jgi:L,D-transpeptidase catalytic domain
MVQGMQTAVRTSWLTLALTAALAFTVPAVASSVGAAAAAPSPSTHLVSDATATRTVVTHSAASARPAQDPGRSTSRHGESPSARPQTGWHRASMLVHVPGAGIDAHASPSRGSRVVGRVVAASKYYGASLVLWVMSVDHGWGRVELPYVWPRTSGWIPLDGLSRERTFIHVDVDLSEHRVRVFKHDGLLASAAAAIGAPSSPTPPGHYVVTDRVPFAAGGYLGSFAFGISGIQPRLPAGWSGGNQLAIHGTNAPSSIGTSSSAGCVRVSEATLDALKPLLRPGTPVVIHQ